MARNRFLWQLSMAAVLATGAVTWLESSRGDWAIAVDVQKYYRCLPFDWYVVSHDVARYVPQPGDLVQFIAPTNVERFTGQFEVIKIIAAVAGDTWEIEKDEFRVNGRLWGGLPLLTTLELSPGALDGAGIVPEGHVLVLGTNPSSYDSRYWGPLEVGAIKGRAHVLL